MGLKEKQNKNKTRRLSILIKMLFAKGFVMVAVTVLLAFITCKQVEDGLVDVAVEATDTAGKVVGIIGCDYDAKTITQSVDNSMNTIITTSVIVVLVGVMLLCIVIVAVLRNLKKSMKR